MRNHSIRPRRSRAATTFVVLVLAVALSDCGLDEIQTPSLEGPAEFGLSLAMTATPDVITADGFSTSLITATLRDQNGRVVAGRDIFFHISDANGFSADIGSLRTSNGPGTGATVRTDAQGVAAVVYEAPARTDATANQTVLVVARPVGNDANTINYRQVRIELRSAEPRFFPQAGATTPICDFTVQVTGKSTCTGAKTCTIPVGTPVLFQSTSFVADGTIIRYYWNFGNGTTADHPDVSTVYRIPLVYVVTHVVTSNTGGVAACQATLTVK